MSYLLFYLWSFTALLIAKAIYGGIFLFRVTRYLSKPSTGNVWKHTKFVLFVPLLHEAGIVPQLVKHFSDFLKDDPATTVVFVTTEREFIDGSLEQNTVQSLSRSLRHLEPSLQQRTKHLHYPHVNKTLAEQLNYGVKQINRSIPSVDEKKTFYGFYNADSRTKPTVLKTIRHALHQSSSEVIFQQSSAFFQNHQTFNGVAGWILRVNALRQTRWTFLHEIPRYLKNKTDNISLIHLVTHGLFIRADVLKQVGYFPTDGFGEDLYLGFILRGFGYVVHPIPILENSDSPTTLKSMLRQKYVWFWGPLGYLYYGNRFRKRFPKQWKQRPLLIIGTSFLGVLDALNWLLAGFGFYLFFYAGWKLGYGWFVACLGLGYLWLTSALTIYIYHKQKDKNLFPDLNPIQSVVSIILSPLIVFLHGLPPFATIMKEGWLRIFPHTYLRPKTERR